MTASPAPATAWSYLARVAAPASIIIASALSGCASSAPVAYEGLSSAAQLQPLKDDDAPFQYRSPAADLRNYSKILIDPVTIYAGRDAQFGPVSQEDREIIADYMQQKFAEVLRSKDQIVATPESGALRLHLTLTGIETSTPVLSRSRTSHRQGLSSTPFSRLPTTMARSSARFPMLLSCPTRPRQTSSTPTSPSRRPTHST
jgi:hypothetical protein